MVSFTWVHDYVNHIADIIIGKSQDIYKVYSCNVCKTVTALTGSYIAYVEEEDFLINPAEYINNAYDKSENDAAEYDLTKAR